MAAVVGMLRLVSCPRQVQKDVRTDVHLALSTKDSAAIAKEKIGWKRRARATWSHLSLKHDEDEEGPKRKRYRTKAFEWLIAAEQQIYVCTGKRWADFCWKGKELPEAKLIPTISMSADQGSDGWSAAHFLLYSRQAALVLMKDSGVSVTPTLCGSALT